MEENIELQDSQTPDESETLESLATPETVEASQAVELAEKNKKLFARAKQAEEDRKRLKEELAAIKQPKAPQQTPQEPKTDDIESVLSLRAKGHSDAEILTLRKYARKMGVSIDEVMNDPFIMSGIEAERAKAKVDSNTPPPSSRSVTLREKPVDQLSDKDIADNYQELMSKAIQAGKQKRFN